MDTWKRHLDDGQVIPACPLAMNADASWSRQHQRELVKYYLDAGAGGLAVGVHTTQFAIRNAEHALLEPVLRLVSTAIDDHLGPDRVFVKVAGVCGQTPQAESEARLAADCGYHAGLLSLTAMAGQSDDEIVRHCEVISEIIPVFGFYLQPDIGGLKLSYRFWRRFCEIANVAAIKMAPFNRYDTLDVVRAVIDSGRDDIALYTGNDDNIVGDLLTPFHYNGVTRHVVGGLLGQWAVWTRRAVQMLNEIKSLRGGDQIAKEWLTLNAELTDANGALFDAANGYRGCIPGITEILRRSGLVPTNRCLDPNEVLSPGQEQEIDRVCQAYPHLTDSGFDSFTSS